MPTFGKRSNQRPQSGGGEFEMFIKTFGDGQSRIRILEDDPNQWVDYKEHYDHGLKISFPCADYEEPGSDCVGCKYPVEHEEYADLDASFPGLNRSQARDARKAADKGWGVRDVSSKWVFPCIDAKGYISLYKIGFDFWKEWCGHYEILGSVTAQEFVVKREGQGFGTTTQATPVPGEVRQPKYPVPGAEQISEALGRKYLYALEKYGIEPSEVPTPHVETSTEDAPDTGPAAEEPTGDEPFVPREKSAGEIKDWLENVGKVSYPPKAPRQVLVGLAEKRLTEMAQGEPPF